MILLHRTLLSVIICIGTSLTCSSLYAQQFTWLKSDDVILNRDDLTILKKDSSKLTEGYYKLFIAEREEYLDFRIDHKGNMIDRLINYNSPDKPRSFSKVDSVYVVLLDGKPTEIFSYAAGKLRRYQQEKDGERTFRKSYNENGQLAEEIKYKRGLPLSEKDYGDDGVLQYETIYADDELGGIIAVKTYEPSGKLVGIDSSRIHKYTEFYGSGSIKKTRVTVKDKEIVKEYDVNGKLSAKETSDLRTSLDPDMIWKTRHEYYPNGKIQKTITTSRSKETEKTYNKAGTLLKRTVTDVTEAPLIAVPLEDQPGIQ